MIVHVDDRVLVEAARGGDVDAFEQLVLRHEQRVYRVALRMLGSRADAQDAAQEALVRAWRSLPTFRGESSVATWLYRIVTNQCLTVLAGRHEHALIEDVATRGDDDPAIAVARSAEVEAVTRAVAALPIDQRAAVVLRDYEGLSYEEIADVLQIGVGAVKSRIHRGRAEVLKRTVGWH